MDEPFVTKDEVKSVYSLPLKVSDGNLIDFETTGIPGVDSSCEVVTLGYLQGDTVTIIQRSAKGTEHFYGEVRRILDSSPRPFYSYNTQFERDIMQLELGMNVFESDFVDLMSPWKAKADEIGLKWPRLDELISEPEDYYGEGKITGRNVPELWSKYLSTGDQGILKHIMEHCFSDILREATLLLRYPYYTRPRRSR